MQLINCFYQQFRVKRLAVSDCFICHSHTDQVIHTRMCDLCHISFFQFRIGQFFLNCCEVTDLKQILQYFFQWQPRPKFQHPSLPDPKSLWESDLLRNLSQFSTQLAKETKIQQIESYSKSIFLYGGLKTCYSCFHLFFLRSFTKSKMWCFLCNFFDC